MGTKLWWRCIEIVLILWAYIVFSGYIFISRWLIHNSARSESYYLCILFGQPHHMMWNLKGSDLNSCILITIYGSLRICPLKHPSIMWGNFLVIMFVNFDFIEPVPLTAKTPIVMRYKTCWLSFFSKRQQIVPPGDESVKGCNFVLCTLLTGISL